VFEELARRYGWTYAAIAAMTPRQVLGALHRGKPPEPGVRNLTAAEAAAILGYREDKELFDG
jgi:hypothetical protein